MLSVLYLCRKFICQVLHEQSKQWCLPGIHEYSVVGSSKAPGWVGTHYMVSIICWSKLVCCRKIFWKILGVWVTSWQNLQSNSHREVTYHQTLASKAKPGRSEEFTTLCLPICFRSLSLPPALTLPRVFHAMLRKQNALPVGSSLLVIFKSPQKFLLSSAANASCLWKQFQFIFYKGKKNNKIDCLESTASIRIVLLHCFPY